MTNSNFKIYVQHSTSHKSVLMLLLIAMLVLNACSPAQVPSAAPALPAPVLRSTSPAASDSNLVTSLAGVKSATIQIVAEGSFVDPAQGLQTGAGAGSGFIIDKSGLAVTNNHVVTGAALLKVYVGGDSNPRNARVVGVSECSDLAVIDIDGDVYPYLEWYTGKIEPSLEVYVAGFPLGDPEYTLTRGIVAKAHANVKTQQVSNDSAIEIDATIRPGNSGGPLVTKDGQVVGVNYATGPNGENYSISRADALNIIDPLRGGHDVTSLGLNGQAINDGQGVAGIWVASVKSGSPADKAGIRGGDLLTSLEGLPLASDGTTTDYCDILRSHQPGDTLAVEVWRTGANDIEVLKGEINGDKLTQFAVFSPDSRNDAASTATTPASSGYDSVGDDSGVIKLDVPASWQERDGSALTSQDKQVLGASIKASADLKRFDDNASDTPGVWLVASRQLATVDTNELLDKMKTDDSTCTYKGRNDYHDGIYTGQFDLWVGCGDAKSSIIKVAAVPESQAFLIYLEFHAVTKADVDAFDHIIKSLTVVGDLP
jgi:serine protease Do